ncbi:glyoxylase-like metal-dependent hydrolase (beta-lactamase superfamily II) [Oxalobacteraceae bacterium GrIS 2.11]
MKKLSMKLKRSALALVACSVLTTLVSAPTLAAAPMAKTSAPGFFRIMLGDVEVTAISDGTTDLPVDTLLTNTTKQAVDKELAQSYLKSPLESSFNGYVINTGTKLVLIDTGAGNLFGPTLGNFVANLKASGYTPDQIDEIYITHMHPDHVGGLTKDGMAVFPNAVVRAEKREGDYWLSAVNMEKADPKIKGFFQGAQASLAPYVAASRFKFFEGDVELVPGIHSHTGKGHTPGHAEYVVESKGQKLVLIGDLIHVGAVQFAHPSVTIAFDSDAVSAEAERKAEFSNAAKEGYLLGGAHLQFPGLGHVAKDGKGYRWIPVNYTQMR